MDQDENTPSVVPETASRAVSEPVAPSDDAQPPRAKPHPLSISMSMDDTAADTPTEDALEDLRSLDPTVGGLSAETLQIPTGDDAGDISALDIASLGPDGTPFEGGGDLAQLQATGSLLGQAIDTDSDPFKET